MAPLVVKDVFSKNFSKVHESDTLSECLSLFKERMSPVLAVLDRKGKYKGVIARRWMQKPSIPDETTGKVGCKPNRT